MAEEDSLLKDFIEESREHLATIEADLLRIEEGGEDIDEVLVNKVFRAAHSIKGASGFFGLLQVKELAHKAESVLDQLRSRKMKPSPEVTNVLLRAFDMLREMILGTPDGEPPGDIAPHVAALQDLASRGAGAVVPAGTVQGPAWIPVPGPESIPFAMREEAARKDQYIYGIECDLVLAAEGFGGDLAAFLEGLAKIGPILNCDVSGTGPLDLAPGSLPAFLLVATVLDPDFTATAFPWAQPAQVRILFDPHAAKAKPAASMPTPNAAEGQATVSAPIKIQPSPTVHTAGKTMPAAPAAEETLRVDVRLLENLMNLAGELVLSRNQLRAAVNQDNRPLLASANQRINQVTSELQDVIMQTRLQPINTVFAKFPRLVRDLSRSLGKEIVLDIQGKEVALDKSLIEGLSDPLTHMVRNAVDHGVETSDERRKAGKPAQGTVRIAARHEAGQVVIEIADDGKGLDPERIAEAAVRKGLLTADGVAAMAPRDKQALIFLPGLSTAKQVSDVSGRGVGMDVVKTNLDRLGGQVEIDSQVGRGSTFRIKLPLTLAIIPSLIVSVAGERFAFPQANIEELLRLRPDEFKTRIEVVGNREVLILRDRLLPLARLDEAIGRPEADRRVRTADRRSPRHPLDAEAPRQERPVGGRDRRSPARSALEIAVVNAGTFAYGLVVGAFLEPEEVVVKPLGRRLKHLREYSGATILGDGTVALILDAPGLAVKCGLAPVTGTARAARLAAEEEQRLNENQALLLFQGGAGYPCALPLDQVQRIERIRPAQVETLGSQRSMQYRGRALPLLALSDVAPVPVFPEAAELVVLIASANGREVGLLGAMPVDVIETRANVDPATHRSPGVAGSAILAEVTTFIVDLYGLADAARPDWAVARPTEAGEASPGATVVLAEDSDFFRSQIRKYLSEAGLRVLDAPDGEAAWELLLANLGEVRAVVTDIEMPRLSGLGLAARIRGDARTAELPIIAVTSLASEDDAARGKAAGIDVYMAKLDRDQLLSGVLARIRSTSTSGESRLCP